MSINLAPWREWAWQKKWRAIMMRCFWYSIIFVGMTVVVKIWLQDHARYLQKQILAIQTQIQSIPNDPHFQEKYRLLKKLQWQKQLKIKTEKSNVMVENALAMLANQLPSQTVLQDIHITHDKIILHGKSSSLSEIHQYQQQLRTASLWKTVTISEMRNKVDLPNILQFTIQIIL